jgi:hypothetical protein
MQTRGAEFRALRRRLTDLYERELNGRRATPGRAVSR